MERISLICPGTTQIEWSFSHMRCSIMCFMSFSARCNNFAKLTQNPLRSVSGQQRTCTKQCQIVAHTHTHILNRHFTVGGLSLSDSNLELHIVQGKSLGPKPYCWSSHVYILLICQDKWCETDLATRSHRNAYEFLIGMVWSSIQLNPCLG